MEWVIFVLSSESLRIYRTLEAAKLFVRSSRVLKQWEQHRTKFHWERERERSKKCTWSAPLKCSCNFKRSNLAPKLKAGCTQTAHKESNFAQANNISCTVLAPAKPTRPTESYRTLFSVRGILAHEHRNSQHAARVARAMHQFAARG